MTLVIHLCLHLVCPLPPCRPHQLSERQIVVGICAMMKKSKSKPMTQILERLCKFDYIDVVIFPEDVILEQPVEKWPLCDCLISFHSKGNVFICKERPVGKVTWYFNAESTVTFHINLYWVL